MELLLLREHVTGIVGATMRDSILKCTNFCSDTDIGSEAVHLRVELLEDEIAPKLEEQHNPHWLHSVMQMGGRHECQYYIFCNVFCLKSLRMHVKDLEVTSQPSNKLHIFCLARQIHNL